MGGKKFKICWHVNNLKVSHVESKEVTKFMDCIEGIYRDMSITRVKVYGYLGMKFYFWTPGELRLTMVDYVLEVLPERIKERSTILEANFLFQVRPGDDQMLLDGERATVFHHTVL